MRIQKTIDFELHRPNLSAIGSFARRWILPNPGTLILMVVLSLAVPALAGQRSLPEATSTSTISYQGRLADNLGNPLTGYYDLSFRVYDSPTATEPLWTEDWDNENSVAVSDGLFNVMLGSINATLADSIAGHSELYLGIQVNQDSEMVPRVQLGSVPFSMQAMTVANGAVGSSQLADAFGASVKPLSNVIIQPWGDELWSGPMPPGTFTLDLRNQTSPSATAIILHVYLSDISPNDRIRLFYPGEANPSKKQILWALSGGIEMNSSLMIVPCDANQVIEYATTTEDQLDSVVIRLLGWIEPAK